MDYKKLIIVIIVCLVYVAMSVITLLLDYIYNCKFNVVYKGFKIYEYRNLKEFIKNNSMNYIYVLWMLSLPMIILNYIDEIKNGKKNEK
jgi:hypothetical protein